MSECKTYSSFGKLRSPRLQSAAALQPMPPPFRSRPLVLLLGLLLAPAHARTEASLAPLSELEWKRYLDNPPYVQPKWPRPPDYGSTSTAHLMLQRAVESHQQGDLDKTVQLLKSVLQKQAPEYHGEAFAALAKALDDQGKHDLAERAMSKATRLYNDGLAQWSLF